MKTLALKILSALGIAQTKRAEKIISPPLPSRPVPVKEKIVFVENLYEFRLAMQRQRDGIGARKFHRKMRLRQQHAII